ncbi:MAG: response regulator transcription factor [Kineosporiaceae bacterium]|nr:response regulator transcription factor [Kineosporiaceae bacterium]
MDLILSEREQAAWRTLLTEEPLADRVTLSPNLLQRLAVLVPADAISSCVAANTGTVTHFVQVPTGYHETHAVPVDHNGPFYVGTMHWSRLPRQAATCGAILPGHADGLSLGFRSGPDAVAQVAFDRRRRPFTERDLAMLDLLAPVLQRHLRRRPTPSTISPLTVQESRVLMQVATGASNLEIASHLFISVGTVRKHLENAYRKLGVANRMAAVVAFEGRPLLDPERGERVARYA